MLLVAGIVVGEYMVVTYSRGIHHAAHAMNHRWRTGDVKDRCAQTRNPSRQHLFSDMTSFDPPCKWRLPGAGDDHNELEAGVSFLDVLQLFQKRSLFEVSD